MKTAPDRHPNSHCVCDGRHDHGTREIAEWHSDTPGQSRSVDCTRWSTTTCCARNRASKRSCGPKTRPVPAAQAPSASAGQVQPRRSVSVPRAEQWAPTSRQVAKALWRYWIAGKERVKSRRDLMAFGAPQRLWKSSAERPLDSAQARTFALATDPAEVSQNRRLVVEYSQQIQAIGADGRVLGHHHHAVLTIKEVRQS